MLRLRQDIAHVGRVSVMGQISAALAHEINQPLGAILRNAEAAALFMQHPSPDLPEIRAILEDIRKDDQRASEVIERIRALLRHEEVAMTALDMSQVLGDVATLLRPDATARRVALQLDVAAGLPPVRGDQVQVQQVLLNLILNGMDALEGLVDRPRSVRVTARRDGPAGNEISVSDSGRGIDSEHFGRIFDPFFTTKPVGKGTGLGLSQAFGFAKQSDGDIAVVSDPGQGATFTIYLPQAAVPADAVEAAATGSQPAARGRGYRVLVVEDNDDVGQFSTELLEDLGYTVRRVASADAALAILAQDEFSADLVFSDVIMPGMNGVELAGIVRERYPGLPVVLTSGYSNVLAENAHHGFELIQKPYSVELLSRSLRKAISEARR
jgi:CheY-like chemotaxis protein